jgi:FKBP-type peptidyl-prolyl cis-trans isomerase FklB
MKKLLLTSALVFATPTLFAADAPTTAPVATTAMDAKGKASYSLGSNIGSQFKRDDLDLDLSLFSQGINDSYNGTPPKMTEDEMRITLDDLRKTQMDKMKAKMEKMAKDNLDKSNAFLAENKKNKGVITLDSGLQYQVISSGPATGTPPRKDQEVTVNYRGTLLDGREFDSTYKRNEPATFLVSSVIEGWQQALLLMKPGDKWKLFIPPQLAYGDQGIGNMIEPNSLLTFEVELISVKDKAPPVPEKQ